MTMFAFWFPLENSRGRPLPQTLSFSGKIKRLYLEEERSTLLTLLPASLLQQSYLRELGVPVLGSDSEKKKRKNVKRAKFVAAF